MVQLVFQTMEMEKFLDKLTNKENKYPQLKHAFLLLQWNYLLLEILEEKLESLMFKNSNKEIVLKLLEELVK